jgi:hypothetical protein
MHALSELGEKFIEVSFDWRDLMRTVFNVVNMRDKKIEFIDEVVNKTVAISGKERILFRTLQNLLS